MCSKATFSLMYSTSLVIKFFDNTPCVVLKYKLVFHDGCSNQALLETPRCGKKLIHQEIYPSRFSRMLMANEVKIELPTTPDCLLARLLACSPVFTSHVVIFFLENFTFCMEHSVSSVLIYRLF